MQAEFFAAVYGIIKNEEQNILFGKRCNTGYMDGNYQLPAGHVEGYETYFEALRREMNEEVGIDIQESDVELIHICHRINKGERVYFDIYFNIKNWSGELKNNEKEKCEEIRFLNYKEDKESQFAGYVTQVLGEIEKGNMFSEQIS